MEVRERPPRHSGLPDDSGQDWRAGGAVEGVQWAAERAGGVFDDAGVRGVGDFNLGECQYLLVLTLSLFCLSRIECILFVLKHLKTLNRTLHDVNLRHLNPKQSV